MAIHDIAAGEEITIDYRQVFTERGLDWRTALRAPTPDAIGELLASLHGGREPHEVSASIHDLLTNMLADTANHRAMRTEHVIADGMYLRKLFIPKETLVVGKIHLMTALNIVATGDVTILTQFGTKRLKAGFTGVSKAGIQKVAWAHEDTVFINVFRTDLTDLAAIEVAIAQDITQGELGCL